MTSGIHHITAITRKIQANVDFYAGFLGLKLVKRTAGYEDADQLHLFYGDAAASPGSLVTFLAWEDGSPGRVGLGQPSAEGGDFLCETRVVGGAFRLIRAHLRNQIDETLHFLLEPVDGVEFRLGGPRCCRLDHSCGFLLRACDPSGAPSL